MANLVRCCTLFLACLAYSALRGQDNLPTFGKVDIADLQMKECSFDKGASAMNLICSQYAKFSATPAGYFIEIEHWKRIKIFSQQGFAYASVEIPFISKDGNTHITDLIAKTYNVDDHNNIEVQTIEKDDIFKEKKGKDESSIHFAFPGVKPGSVIELKYIEQKAYTLYLPPWQLQDVIPTRLSICKLSYLRKMGINFRAVGGLSTEMKADTAENGSIYCAFLVKNVKSFRPEPMMTSIKDNLQRIEFAATPTSVPLKGKAYWYTFLNKISVEDDWALFNTQLLESPLFGEQFKKRIPGIDEEVDSIKKLATDEEKIKAAYYLVKNAVKWKKDDDFSTANVAEAWKNKAGNKTEVNLLLLNLLLKAGIHAYPLLVSTRDNGKTDINFPDYGQFNGTDVFIGDSANYYVLDATQNYQPYKIPPFDIFNRYALIIDKKNCKWIFVTDTRQLMKNAISVKASIDSTGIMKGEVRISYYDYAKAEVIGKTKDEAEDDSKDLLQGDITDLKIDSVKEENENDVLKPLIKSFRFTLEMQQTGDFYFLDPFFLSPFRKNPFIDSVRHTDIDFGCNQLYAINMFISLPSNITVTDLPANKEIRLADSSFAFGRMIAKQGDAMVVRTHFEVLNPIFSADEYPFLKQVFEKVYGLLNERIVFKKTN